MITIIKGQDVKSRTYEMEHVWRLRHEVFVEEKKWMALSKPDQREIDEFDDVNAIHMLAWEGNELVGYQRLLPTTEPYLLSAIYPQLCETELPKSAHVFEWTRYAVKKEHRARGRMLSPVANHLLSAIVEWGVNNDVNSVIIEMNPLWMLRLVQLQFRVVPLGICHLIEGEDVLAVQAHFDRRTLAKLQDVRGNTQAILNQSQYAAG